MSISMSGATITDDERRDLNSKEVDTSITDGGATANTRRTGFLGLGGKETTGAKLAGVTPSFAKNVCNAMDTYTNSVKESINKLDSKVSSNAFKGSGITKALQDFIEEVKVVANSYLDKLNAAEQEIINSVDTAYQTQDTDLSGDMSGDTTTLDGQKAM